MTDDLVAFLRARLDDDEQVARAAIGTEGETRSWTELITAEAIREQEHNDRHDPARVLAEVDAKRRIIAEHRPDKYHPDDCRSCRRDEPGWEYGVPAEWPCPTLRALALPYRGHPDYRPEWAPEA